MQKPYISRVDVGAALNSLVHNTRKQESGGLRYLLLVDMILAAPEMPDADNIREYAVRELLTSEITRALNEQRAVLQLSPVNGQADMQAVRDELVIGVNVPTLTIWNILYYRYVRTDLALSVEQLANLLAVHARTVARQTDEGIEALTRRLIDAERLARREHLARRLRSRLPQAVPVWLAGRTEALRQVEKTLERIAPRHALISGVAGVGKTAFVQELIRRQIDGEALQQLVWIDAPVSTEFVMQRLIELLLRDGAEMTLTEYFLVYRVAVVLDGIDHLLGDRNELQQLLRELSAADVFLISIADDAAEYVEVHHVLGEIDQASSALLVERLLSRQILTSASELAAYLYEFVGGNPRALRLALRFWEASRALGRLPGDLQDQFLNQIYTTGSETLVNTWSALALSPGGVPSENLVRWWGIREHDTQLLAQYSMVEISPEGRVTLLAAARSFLRQQAGINQEAQERVSALLEQAESVDAFEVIEYALESGFPEASGVRKGKWILQWWREGFRQNHWALWRGILEKHLQQTDVPEPELQVAYAICLRRLTLWERAEQVFENVVAVCGKYGLFNVQAWALLEWSVLAKLRGDFVRANAFIEQAKRYAHRSRSEAIRRLFRVREIELMLQQQRGESAYRLLASLPETGQMLALQSEAQLLSGNYVSARTLAESALDWAGDDQVMRAGLYTILGQTYEQEGNIERSSHYFSDALTLLERLDDPFSLARAETNLAAVLIHLARLTDAGLLLSRAEQIQTRLGDRVGLSVTRHNRRILERYIAR